MENGDAKERQLVDAGTLDWQAYRILSIQPHGFGEERVRIWPKLVHLDELVLEDKYEASNSSVWSDTTLEQTAIEGEVLEGDPHADEHQIELDTDRSFVLYPVAPEGESSRQKLQTALNKLIVSVFRRRPRLHYFQGYHDIVSVVFLTLPQELRLPVIEKLSLHRARDSMGTNLDPVVGLLRILMRLLRLADAEFAASLERTAPLPYYALSNILTLFSHDVPTLSLIQHIFDYLLCRPPIAVVYLAAVLILARRQEVQVLEDEGEEGMMHSLLTVLPDLYEEGEENLAQPKSEEPSVPVPVAQEVPVGDIEKVKVEGVPEESDATGVTLDATPVSSSRHVDTQESEHDASQDGTTASDPPAKLDPISSEPGANSEEIDVSPNEDLLPEAAAQSEVKLEPSDHSLADAEADDEKATPPRMASPEPLERDPRPRRPRVSLTTLLMQADELFVKYPPTHPGIALSSIMGPQSVMLTWSERASDLPSDDEAELMVTRPELIVLPYVEESSSDDEFSDHRGKKSRREKGKDKEERRRRRLRKPRRLTDIVVQRKTMVAGAVLVLGVAMAVYGFNAGLPNAGNGYHRGGFGREWKKVGKLLGGFVNAGGRAFDGIRHGLQ